MTLPDPYRGHAAPSWDTVTLSTLIGLLGGVGNPPALGGTDLAGKIVGRNRRTNSVAMDISSGVQSGATAIMSTQASLSSGRIYYVFSPGFGLWSGIRAGIIVRAQITYTTDGSNPTTISTTLDMSQITTQAGGNVSACNIGKLYVPPGNVTFKCLLSAYLVGPSAGDKASHYGAGDWPTDLVVMDTGPDPGTNGTNY